MASEWRDTTLGEVLTLQRGFDLPKSQRVAGQYPVIASTGPVGSHEEPKVRGPGVVIGRSGSLGGGQFIRGDFWPLNTTLWVKDFKGNDLRYCYYLLRSLDLAHFNAGSGVPTLNRNHIHPYPVTVPSAQHEQRAIARVLGALDDKIELTREINKTLEAMAQAIFKSWFVDFDPVTAKAAGQKPFGLDADTAALFPDRFVDSELGPIPEGWEVVPLREDFELTMGQSPPGRTYNQEGDGIPFYQGRTDFGFRFPTRRVYCTAPTRFAESGDTLVSVRAPVGDVNLAWERCAIGRGLSALRHASRSSTYTFQQMRNLEADFAVFEGEGTLFGSISKKKFEAIQVLRPSADAVTAFDTLATPLDERLRLAWDESHTLACLRDSLLPKLLSGEIRVGQAEAEVEAAL